MKLSQRTTCVISDRFKFKFLLIAKNATTTVRREFAKAAYQSRESYVKDLDLVTEQSYFTFTCVRDPVSRVLSAYHEISYRLATGHLEREGLEFWKEREPKKRFQIFLQDIPVLTPEPHVRRQVDYIDGINIDCFICFERFQVEMESVFQTLQLGDCPSFPKLRSREQIRERNLNLNETDIDASTRGQILDIYAKDMDLYSRVSSN